MAVSETLERVIEVKGLGPGRVSEDLVAMATEHGYAVAASGPNRFRLARTFRPLWANVAALALAPLFGLGLFFLLVKRTESCEAIISEDRAGVRLSFSGTISPDLFVHLHDIFTKPPAAAPPPPATAFAQHPLPQPAPSDEASPPHPGDDERTVTVAKLAFLREPPPSLQLPDGRVVAIGRGVVIGRNPEADTLLPAATLCGINDPSLSKTHATFGVSSRGVWVRDHHSTNGTSLCINGSTVGCQPGTQVDVPAGARVVVGELSVAVVGAAQ